MSFHDPHLLWLLLALMPWAWVLRVRAARAPAAGFADAALFTGLPDTLRCRVARGLPWLQLLLLALAILALARPQLAEPEADKPAEGVDLVVAIDVSTSMLAESLQAPPPRKNRLHMAREVLDEFIAARPGDRIGLVAFAARPYLAAPLTLDHDWLRASVARLETGVIEDGTALGDALLAAVNRLRSGPQVSTPRSAAVILITDGRDNAGKHPPHQAAAAARALGIRVHVIGIGARGAVVVPIADPLGGTRYRQVAADLDEATLREIAVVTGGTYFRADDRGVLARVFQEIDRLEKRPQEGKIRYRQRELYPPLLYAVLALALAGATLRATWLRGLP